MACIDILLESDAILLATQKKYAELKTRLSGTYIGSRSVIARMVIQNGGAISLIQCIAASKGVGPGLFFPDVRGRTLFHLIAEISAYEYMRCLVNLDKQYAEFHRDRDGLCAVHLCLLAHKSMGPFNSSDIRTAEGLSIEMFCISNRIPIPVGLASDIRAVDNLGRSASHVAIDSGDSANMLISVSPDFWPAPDHSGRSLCAAMKNNPEFAGSTDKLVKIARSQKIDMYLELEVIPEIGTPVISILDKPLTAAERKLVPRLREIHSEIMGDRRRDISVALSYFPNSGVLEYNGTALIPNRKISRDIIWLPMNLGGDTGHMNVIIVDRASKSALRYEPKVGSLQYSAKRLDAELHTFFKKRNIAYSLLRSQHCSPQKDDQTCLFWCVAVIHVITARSCSPLKAAEMVIRYAE